MASTLYLLPTTIGSTSAASVLPASTIERTRSITHFVVENLRTARRYLSKLQMPVPIDELFFYELNEHTKPEELTDLLNFLREGHNVGLMSEAGVPAVADPGTNLVRLAHQEGIRVVPMVGPSSILLAVMASGLSGQNFAFNGYLPVKEPERTASIRQFEKRSLHEQQAQVFIEAPYRNVKLFEALLAACHRHTSLCIAANITEVNEAIRTFTIEEWSKRKPNIDKQPCIFILQA